MPRRPFHDRERPVTVCLDINEDGILCGPMVIKSSKVTQERIRISGSAEDVGRLVNQLPLSVLSEVPRGELFAVDDRDIERHKEHLDSTGQHLGFAPTEFYCLRHLRSAVDCGQEEYLCAGCVAEERLMWRTAARPDRDQIDLELNDD